MSLKLPINLSPANKPNQQVEFALQCTSIPLIRTGCRFFASNVGMFRDFLCFAVTFAAIGGRVNTRPQSGANVLFLSSLWAAVAETFVELAAVFLNFICKRSPHRLRIAAAVRVSCHRGMCCVLVPLKDKSKTIQSLGHFDWQWNNDTVCGTGSHQVTSR